MPRSRTISEDMKHRLDAAGVCRIGTAGPDGPHISPLCHAFDGDTTIYMATAPNRQIVRNLERSSQALVLVDEYDDDWSKTWHVSFTGTGRIVPEGAEFDKAAGLLNTKFPQFAAIGLAVQFVVAIDLTGVRHSEGVDTAEG